MNDPFLYHLQCVRLSANAAARAAATVKVFDGCVLELFSFLKKKHGKNIEFKT